MAGNSGKQTSRRRSAPASLDAVRKAIAAAQGGLSPQLRLAARYVLDNSAEVAVYSMRALARRAAVTPSTLMRLAKEVGFTSYAELRRPFQEAMRHRAQAYGDRARGLQRLGEGEGDELYVQSASSHLANMERTFSDLSAADVRAAAITLRDAERIFIVGMRAAFGLAHHAHYVGRMALPNLVFATPTLGDELDQLATATHTDAVLAFSFRPYSQATVKAVRYAARRGVKTIAISDTWVSPLTEGAAHVLVVPTESPHYFPSFTPALALTEMLLAAVVVASGNPALRRIAAFERMQREVGFYWDDG